MGCSDFYLVSICVFIVYPVNVAQQVTFVFKTKALTYLFYIWRFFFFVQAVPPPSRYFNIFMFFRIRRYFWLIPDVFIVGFNRINKRPFKYSRLTKLNQLVLHYLSCPTSFSKESSADSSFSFVSSVLAVSISVLPAGAVMPMSEFFTLGLIKVE